MEVQVVRPSHLISTILMQGRNSWYSRPVCPHLDDEQSLERCGGPGDMVDSRSTRLGSRGRVAWIQQNASIASVFTPDLGRYLSCQKAEGCSRDLVSKMQCMGSPRYCLAAVRADMPASRNTVTSPCSLA